MTPQQQQPNWYNLPPTWAAIPPVGNPIPQHQAIPTMLQAGVRVNKPQIITTQKRGTKISIRWFLLWCFVFLILLSGFIGLWLYYIIQNPEQIGWNIDIDTVKQWLRIFAALFFWFLFFLWFWLVIVNAFRLSTTKEWWKWKFIIWLIFWILILIWSISWWIIILQNINNIVWSELQTNNIVLIKVPVKNWTKYLHNTPGIVLIAPMSLTFELNRTIFDRTIINNIWNNQLRGVSLDCWNWQILVADPSSYQFIWSCLYQTKWTYNTNVIVQNLDNVTWVVQEAIFQAGTLSFNSEISITTANWAYTLNDAKNEINIWKAPSKLFIDASKIFEDFWLQTYEIDWDIDGDWAFDIKDDAVFTHNYKVPGIQKIYYTIPGLWTEIYEINFRVAQNDVPICEIEPEVIKDNTYNLIVKCDDLTTPIVEYSFEVFDQSLWRKISTEKSQRPLYRYTFPKWWDYVIKLSYITNEWKIWKYETDNIKVWNVSHVISYSLYYKWVTSSKYELVDNNETKDLYLKNWELIIQKIPVEVQLTLDSIVPASNNTIVKVLFNQKPILSSDNNKNFNFTVNAKSEQEIIINVSEPNQPDNITEISFPIKIEQSQIVWRLLANEWTVWFDPFEVTLDASTTTLTDPTDEIVFFTWDFGDGEIKRDTSQWAIKHTYKYDTKNNNGEYNPKVTIKTKKWLLDTIFLDEPILVKKKNIEATIKSLSHLSQVAWVWETVFITLTTDWDPKKILWDFGNWDTLECAWRECLETSITYRNTGEYSIKANVEYSDWNETISNSLKIIVEN